MATSADTRPATPTPDGDAELLALVATPYRSVAETRRRLRALLSAFEARDDRRADFLTVYVRTTEAVADRIERGGFTNPDWVADYLVAFANRYRRAVRADVVGDVSAVPPAWRLAFAAAERVDASAVRTAALGVNAHINHDLALALDEVGIATARETKRDDHRAVTDVIAGLAESVRSTLLARDDGAVAPSAGRVAAAIGGCRERAWQTAVALDSRLRVRRRLARWINRRTATVGARVVLRAPLTALLADLPVGSDAPPGATDGTEPPASRSAPAVCRTSHPQPTSAGDGTAPVAGDRHHANTRSPITQRD